MVPERFQIVLVLNEYGDFLSDMACGLAGSLGIGAGANLGFDAAAVVRVALFDAAHGTAPDIAGKNLANPTAIFLALALLLYQVGEIALDARSRRQRLTCCAKECAPATWAVKNRRRASPTRSPRKFPAGLYVRRRRIRSSKMSPIPPEPASLGVQALGGHGRRRAQVVQSRSCRCRDVQLDGAPAMPCNSPLT